MVAHGGAMVRRGGSLAQGLEHAMVHQTLHGLLLRDHREMVNLFGLPSSGGSWHGEQAVVTSFIIPQPVMWPSFGR
jgi:hypothetical protein